LLAIAWLLLSGLTALGVGEAVSTTMATLAGLTAYVAVVKKAFPETWADTRLLVSRLVPSRFLMRFTGYRLRERGWSGADED